MEIAIQQTEPIELVLRLIRLADIRCRARRQLVRIRHVLVVHERIVMGHIGLDRSVNRVRRVS